ncbi:hypothetical protein G4X40_21425 [Rhodococcus sp. D2-41]|uniref:hypothetical protein n=1 Tax=Speluncibacter jeojiensis TaxID=2710754 RepID=UPI00240ECF6B|nr:hypothetical protein [Rhodococcus sp. D2-41]MDG3012704.1 hypothetical protein [Rhodococcus sp. D2-41]
MAESPEHPVNKIECRGYGWVIGVVASLARGGPVVCIHVGLDAALDSQVPCHSGE